MSPHVPIMVDEIITGLDIQKDDIILDGTMGFGGHGSALINSLNGSGHYIGIDQDEKAISFCKDLFKKETNISIFHKNYQEFDSILPKTPSPYLNKVLLDLGISSYQLDQAERGFSFQKDEHLDLRMNKNTTLTASNILNSYDKESLSNLFFNYGELHQNKRLTEAILKTRKETPIKTTFQLCELIKSSYFFNHSRSKMIKTYSQVFQALRIEVNQELDCLKTFLAKLTKHLQPNAIVAIISFHSLEDRIVKHFVKKNKQFEPCHKGVIQASENERLANSRAKPAKLRLFKLI